LLRKSESAVMEGSPILEDFVLQTRSEREK
jgi:hypothetical protein